MSPPALWAEVLVSSRLLDTRLVSPARARPHGEPARQLLGRISFLELSPLVLRRALEPFAEPVRTLDALHLASVEFLRSRRLAPRLATYDRRMSTAAQAMAIPLAVL